MVSIIRLVRRICLLREDGEMLDARRMEETELLPAVEAFRKARGEEALPARALEEIFEIETRRVADAGVLCELLVPRLVARLPSLAVAGAVNVAPVSRVGPAPAVPAGGPPAIPDLLDAMLAADRTEARKKSADRTKF